MLPVGSKSQWTESEIRDFLRKQISPIRISCNGGNGFPVICAMWFLFDDGHIWCATHERSALARLLLENNKCAFEVSPNEKPYHGVRGQGVAELIRKKSEKVLGDLVDRYGINRGSKLSTWLFSRVSNEYAIKITPTFLTAWSYTKRMSE